jgi:hypothetical protein
MNQYQGRARLIGRDEHSNVLELCRQLATENALFSMDENKVSEMMAKAYDRQGGILAGIGEPGKLEGIIFLLLTTFWYSNDPYFEEFFLYVTPEHRKSRNAVELLRFAKWCADESGFPLFIGILSNHPTERKELLYERQLKADGYKGRFFVYNTKIKAA